MTPDVFEKQKTKALAKKDLSKKGSIDKNIQELVDNLNRNPDYYTTSSCAGRITIIALPSSGRKYDAEWVYTNHDAARAEDVISAAGSTSKKNVWFKFESAILHISARTLEAANKIIKASKEAGFKHAGIIAIDNRIMVELMGTDRIETPIISAGKRVADDEYLEILCREANRKLERNHKRLEKMKKTIESFR